MAGFKRYIISILYLGLSLGALESREIEAPVQQVEFSVYCMQRLEGLRFTNAEGRTETLRFYSSSRSPKYNYLGTSPIKIFRERAMPGALQPKAIERIPVAEAWIPQSARKLLLVFLANPHPAGLQYIVYSFDDSLANLPVGHIAIFNLSGFTLHGSIGSRPVLLKAGPSISYPLRDDITDLRFGTYFGDRFRQTYSSPVILTDNQRAILFFYPPYLKGSPEIQPRLLIQDMDIKVRGMKDEGGRGKGSEEQRDKGFSNH